MNNTSTYLKFKEDKSQLSINELIELIGLLELRIGSLENQNKQLLKENDHALESESKYKSLFDMSDDAILVIENNTFVDCNRAVVKMLGYTTKEELLNTHPSELSPEKQPDGRFSYEKAQEMMTLALEKGSHHFEWIHTRANKENFPVEVWLSKVEFNDKILINTIWRDLTEKKQTEQTINKNIEEKEILLKEIHHRVKNNLQIITSLLNLQTNNVENEKVKAVLFQSKTRIESMCKVHEMLYSSKDLSSINYADYLQDLLSKLILNAKGETSKIALRLDVEDLFLNINTAIPLGLLINELVTNSLKYAFPNDSEGLITIKINTISPTQFKLYYGDNGIGYPKDISFSESKSLGFQLIESLTEQLNGKIERDFAESGTHYCLIFKKL
ncbi:MAG: histidine kinase dimerization/phosphoacceptor domain -containing protein [Flavobacteriales bacterium]